MLRRSVALVFVLAASDCGSRTAETESTPDAGLADAPGEAADAPAKGGDAGVGPTRDVFYAGHLYGTVGDFFVGFSPLGDEDRLYATPARRDCASGTWIEDSPVFGRPPGTFAFGTSGEPFEGSALRNCAALRFSTTGPAVARLFTTDSAATTLLPAGALGGCGGATLAYVVGRGMGGVTIIATEDATGVTVDIGEAFYVVSGPGVDPIEPLETRTFALDDGDMLTLWGEGDPTGTRVAADAPVAVFAFGGDDVSQLGFAEQMPPVDVWGRQFAAVPLAAEGSVRWRVLAAEDDTVVYFARESGGCPSDPGDGVTLDAGEWLDFLWPATCSFVIEADRPLLVAEFEGSDVDPAMLVVPPVDRWVARQLLTGPLTQAAAVLVKRPETTIDFYEESGGSFTPKPFDADWFDVSSFEAARIAAPLGVFVGTCASGACGFGVTVMSSEYGAAMAYAGDMNLACAVAP